MCVWWWGTWCSKARPPYTGPAADPCMPCRRSSVSAAELAPRSPAAVRPALVVWRGPELPLGATQPVCNPFMHYITCGACTCMQCVQCVRSVARRGVAHHSVAWHGIASRAASRMNVCVRMCVAAQLCGCACGCVHAVHAMRCDAVQCGVVSCRAVSAVPAWRAVAIVPMCLRAIVHAAHVCMRTYAYAYPLETVAGCETTGCGCTICDKAIAQSSCHMPRLETPTTSHAVHARKCLRHSIGRLCSRDECERRQRVCYRPHRLDRCSLYTHSWQCSAIWESTVTVRRSVCVHACTPCRSDQAIGAAGASRRSAATVSAGGRGCWGTVVAAVGRVARRVSACRICLTDHSTAAIAVALPCTAVARWA